MILPRLVPSAFVLLAGLLLSGCPSSVRVETVRVTADATPEVDAADAIEATPDTADVPADLPDGDGSGDVAPEIVPPCHADDDCADLPGLDPCRVWRCLAGACVARPVPGCCRADDDCVPDEPQCRVGSCPVPGQGCVFVDTCTPCGGPADCNDGDPCTANQCADGQCRYQALPGCCASDAPCDDGDPCTADACQAHVCVSVAVPGCCTADTDCTPPADKPCLAGVCHAYACAWKPRPGCCQDDAQCADGDPCTRDSCDAATNACVHLPDPACGGCLTDADCDDGDPCTDHACDYGICETALVPGCCTTDAGCDDGDPCTKDRCQGHACVHEPEPACGGCTSDVQCDDGNPCTKDRCQDGACAHKPDPACGGCTSDAECKDGDACTVDACVQQACVHQAQPDCACHVDADCQDQNPCTKDRCQDGQCTHAQVPDCCQHPLDCSDGNPCTWDLCTDNTCYSYAAPELPGCCGVGTDCPPSPDPCQVAVCRADFTCAIEVAPGCCTEQVVLAASFDADAPGWALLPPNKPVRWSVDPHRFASAPAALYFGNPNTLTYAIPGQASAGTATTPLFELPADAPARLRFALWLDVETQPNVDRLAVRVLEAGSGTPAWTKAELAPSEYRTWTDVEVDLSAWAGHAVRLQFAFDSVDALDNGGEGGVVDDVDVRTTCAP